MRWLITGGGIPRVVPSVSNNRQTQWWLDSTISADSEAVRAERTKQQAPLLRACVRVGVAAPARQRRYALELPGNVAQLAAGNHDEVLHQPDVAFGPYRVLLGECGFHPVQPVEPEHGALGSLVTAAAMTQASTKDSKATRCEASSRA